jgi:hypothetical protein
MLSELAQLAGRDERDRDAGLARAARATGAMDVGGRLLGELVVDDQVEPLHVDATRGHVGRDEDARAAIAELRHHTIAFVLLEIAVQCIDAEPRARELLL